MSLAPFQGEVMYIEEMRDLVKFMGHILEELGLEVLRDQIQEKVDEELNEIMEPGCTDADRAIDTHQILKDQAQGYMELIIIQFEEEHGIVPDPKSIEGTKELLNQWKKNDKELR